MYICMYVYIYHLHMYTHHIAAGPLIVVIYRYGYISFTPRTSSAAYECVHMIAVLILKARRNSKLHVTLLMILKRLTCNITDDTKTATLYYSMLPRPPHRCTLGQQRRRERPRQNKQRESSNKMSGLRSLKLS
jgi:hypothetical protein